MFQKTLSAFLLLLISGSAHANWVEDWFDTMNTTSPSSYQGQERGFATAGGFQARMRVKTDNLMTISPPRLNIGCGGIDIFMGGFSFLNADYIVDKFERIIRMAPALAFQVALNELSSTISEKVEGMEQVMNTLNALQLDECQAAKAVATYTVDMVKSGPTQATSTISQNISTGWDNFWDTALKDTKEKPGKALKQAIDSSSMPAALKAELKKGGSLLANAGGKFGLTTNEINQLRALIGDVEIVFTDKLSFSYEPGCDNATYENLVTGKPLSKTVSGTCFDSAGDNLNERTGKILDSLADKLMNSPSDAPSEKEIGFIAINPIPAKHFLNIAKRYGKNQVLIVKDDLRTPSAYGFAYAIFTNMTENLKDTIEDYLTWIKSGDPDLTISTVTATEKLLAKVKEKQIEAKSKYEVKLKEMNSLETKIQTYENLRQTITKIVKDNRLSLPE
ncbi:conjugal transfer protein TraH [Geovibrio sp. ADMFC3]